MALTDVYFFFYFPRKLDSQTCKSFGLAVKIIKVLSSIFLKTPINVVDGMFSASAGQSVAVSISVPNKIIDDKE